MILTRKVTSAATMLWRKGWGETAGLIRIRASEFYRGHRPVLSDPVRLARMTSAVLNRRQLVSAVILSPEQITSVRLDALRAYLRHRFGEAAAALNTGDLRPVEVVILADCLLSIWDFRRISESMPAWRTAVAGTPFARRIDQTGRRAALRLGRLGEAARDIETIGDDVGALVLRGEILDAQGRMDDARVAFEAAIRRDGTDPDARQSYGFYLLKAGQVRDGLASWSVADALFGTYPLRRHRPNWTGEPLGRQRLMVLFEHGLGVMIQMARFLPRLLEREPNAVVMARLPSPLLGLMARNFPRVRFVSEDEREPDYDAFVPSMQLATVLDAADLAPRGRYIDLGAPVLRSPDQRPRIGVCWRGHPRQYEFTRSITLDLFARLFEARGVEYVVLLHRPTEDETAKLASEPNVSTPPIGDFVDLAALVASCDLVISVDTAVVHLAGAGGVPTVLLSRPDACWRWGAEGSFGPWYDSVEVLRHDGDMDWPRLLDAAAGRIAALCRAPVAA